MDNSSTVLALDQVSQTFRQADSKIKVFEQISMQVSKGEIVALVGPSGSGKSTLLHICGLLEKPEKGRVSINRKWTNKLSDAQKTKLRLDSIGFVYQSHNLLADFTAQRNVALPLIIAGVPIKEADARAMDLLDSMGVSNRAKHRPAKLSGGEQQRVAIARAMANTPDLILADEPTGSLDEATGQGVVLSLFMELRQRGAGGLIATHHMGLAEQTDVIYQLDRGVLKIL